MPRMTKDKERGLKQAFELRKAGATTQQIAEQLGLSEDEIKKHVAKKLGGQTEEEHTIKMELCRLEAMHLALWPKAKGGDASAVRVCLKISEQKERYLFLLAVAKR